MEISTFRAIKAKLLRNQPNLIQIEVDRRIQLILDLLDSEVMSEEGIALVIAQVISEQP